MADAGLRLSVEGEKEFKAALKSIDEQIKVNKSELKLLTEQYKANDGSMDTLVDQQKALAESMELQGQKVETLKKRYEEAAEQYGETDSRVLALKKSLNDASAELVKTSTAFEENAKEITEQKKALEASKKTFELTGKTTDELRKAVETLDAKLKLNQSELKKLNTEMSTGAKNAQNMATKEADLKKKADLLNSAVATQEKKIEYLNADLKVAISRYDENSKEVAEYKKEIADASSELQEMKKSVEDNNEAMGQASGGGMDFSSILEKISGLTGVELPNSITQMTSSLSSGVGSAALDLGAFGIGAKVIKEEVSALVDFIDETGEVAQNIKQSAASLGITNEEYQKLEYTAIKTGVSMDIFSDAFKNVVTQVKSADDAQKNYEKGLEEIDRQLAKAKSELNESWFYDGWEHDLLEANEKYSDYLDAKIKYVQDYNKSLENLDKDAEEAKDDLRDQLEEAKNLWNELGVEIYKDSEKNLRPTQDILFDLFDAFGKITNQTERSGKMMEMFGESAGKLNTFVETGSEKLREYGDEAEDVGYILSDQLIDQYDEAKTKLDVFNVSLERAGTLLLDSVFGLFSLDFDRLGSGISGAWKSFWNGTKQLFGWGSNAYGTYNFPGGLTWVGEKGPELVELPTGSKVYPNNALPDVSGGSTVYNISINASEVREFNDIVRIAENKKISTRMGYVG